MSASSSPAVQPPVPGSFAEVEATPAGEQRYRAAMAYIKRAEAAAGNGRRVRDVELRRLCREHGPTKTAAMTGAHLGTVKAANRPHNDG